MELKVGSVVKCISHSYGDDNKYLTIGRNYDVVSVYGLRGFEIEFNDGQLGYCLTSECAHGEWELAEDAE